MAGFALLVPKTAIDAKDAAEIWPGLGKRAAALLPKVRDWMSANSWIISELVIALFVAIEINNLVSS